MAGQTPIQPIRVPRKMWDGLRQEIDPTIAAVSTLMIAVSVVMLLTAGSRQATFCSEICVTLQLYVSAASCRRFRTASSSACVLAA